MSAPSPAVTKEPQLDVRSIAAAIGSISVVGIAIGLGIPLLSIVMENRGYSASLIGTNTAVAGLASLAAAPFATPMAARFGVARTILAMIVIGALSFIGFYYVDGFWWWALLRTSLHFALTVLFILSEFWITTSSPPNKRGLMLGIYATVLSVGFAIGPWIFSVLGSQGPEPFLAGFIIILCAMAPVLMALRQSPNIADEEHKSFVPFLFAVPTATAAVLVFGAVETGGFALLPIYGTRLGYTESEAAILLSIIGVGNVLMQIPIGLLSDRMRDRRLLLVILAFVGLTGVLSMTLVAANWHLLAMVLFIWGGAVAGLYTVGLAHLGSRLSGRDLASANAAFVFCYAIGMLVGPQVIGMSMDLVGTDGFSWSLALFFGLYAILALTRIFFVRPRA